MLYKSFEELAQIWKMESAHMSTLETAFKLPSYQKILAIGPIVVPAILREMEREPGHWFHALYTLTGEDPARGRGTLTVTECTAIWLDWGRGKGLI